MGSSSYATLEDVARYLRGVDLTGHEADITALCEDASAWMNSYCGVSSLSGLADAATLRMICAQLVVGLWQAGENQGASSLRIGEYAVTWKVVATSDPALKGMLNRLVIRAELKQGAEVATLDYRV
jgi:hypothetical protein